MLELHFLICHPQPLARPGRLREGPVIVTRGPGRVAYQPPTAERVPALVAELANWLGSRAPAAHPSVRAALAHLNLVSIHPFRDGNGHLARIIQSLVLAREGTLRPELESIEPYLSRHTSQYCAVLERVQGPSFDPGRDAQPWIEFCVEAHIVEATERRRWIERAYARHDLCSELARDRGYPERLVMVLDQALLGLPVTNAGYRREAAIASPTAAQDLQRLLRDGWLDAAGGGRSVRYLASATLRGRWEARVTR